MEGVRMLCVLVEYDFRKLGENTLLIPVEETWQQKLAASYCNLY